MRRNSSLKIILIMLAIMMVSIAPVLGVTYTVGVKAGDWIEYGNITSTGSQSFGNFNNTKSLRGDVQSVSGTNITVKATQTFTNGSSKIQIATGDISTGKGNLTDFIISANLGKGDSFPLITTGSSPTTVTLNDTLTRTYGGSSRTVDLYNLTYSYSAYGYSVSDKLNIYWDQATGILMEIYFYYSYSSPSQSTQTSTTSFQATGSSYFPNSSAPLGSVGGINTLYVIAAVVVIVVVAAGGYYFMKMRKPSPTAPSTPTPSEPSTPSA